MYDAIAQTRRRSVTRHSSTYGGGSSGTTIQRNTRTATTRAQVPFIKDSTRLAEQITVKNDE